MPSFIARIELHSGTAADYETLNDAMGALGFGRGVRSDDGTAVCLPTGQYVGNGEVSAAEVSQIAQGAALKTKKGFAIFVSDVTTAAWFGLDPVATA